jgi:hypothetical protein
MKPRWIVALAVCAVLVVDVAVYAMPPGLITRPTPPAAWRVGPQNVKLNVVCDPRVKQPHLLIPRSLLVTTEQPRRLGAATLVPTVVTGLALSAALVIGGLWFAGRGNRAAAAVLLVLGVGLLGAGAVLADIAYPGEDGRFHRHQPRPPFLPENAPHSITLPADIQLPADILLEVAEEGDSILLTVPAQPKPAVNEPKPAPAKEDEGFKAVPVIPGKK